MQWTRLLDGNTPPAFTARIVALLGAPGAAASAAELTHPAVKTGHVAPLALIPRRYGRVDSAKEPPGHRRDGHDHGHSRVRCRRQILALEPAAKRVAAVAPAPTPAMPVISEKSIAVLPFVDMSKQARSGVLLGG